MLLYSFIVFVFLTCIRTFRNRAILPRIANNMRNASDNRRAEIRKQRGAEAQRLA
jgi:hypothetical protein